VAAGGAGSGDVRCTFAATPLSLGESPDAIGVLAVVDVAGRTDEQKLGASLRDLAAGLVDQLRLQAENVGLRQKQANLELQKQVFGLIAEGAPLERILSSLASFIEHQSEGTLCVIHLVDADGRLHVEAGPTMPESLLELIDDIVPSATGCVAARAAFAGEPVVIADLKSLGATACIPEMIEE
jgi:hypothetical protein